ncbi:hypothetical protein N8646_00665 [bacterium]|nr:hypothetical protein [bacterium]
MQKTESSLIVEISADETGTCVSASARSNGFSGSGEAWFNRSVVERFVSDLKELTSTAKDEVNIEGGYWDGAGNLEDTLLSIRVYPFSNSRFGLHIHLEEHPGTDSRKNEISRVSLELKVDNLQLADFQKELCKSLQDQNHQSILKA